MSYLYKLLLAFLTIIVFASQGYAHRGQTDAKGGHVCRTNCEKYGLKQGEYHYHGQSRKQTTSPTREAPTFSSSSKFQSSIKYERKDWSHWTDDDGDCQNTRAEILIRDNVGTIKFKRNKGCNVSWGEWICPYTGEFSYKASDVDVDHVVPLKHAHKTGGVNWSREKKRSFANDPENLLIVDDATNQAKGAKGPVKWRPPLKSYWMAYAEKWLHVKKKYGLYISDREMATLKRMMED